jgi:hypothetical protein
MRPPAVFSACRLVVIMVMIVIAIRMVVPPIPVSLLIAGRQVAEIPVRIPVSLHHPLLVIDILVMIPTMVIVVIRIVHAVGMHGTSGGSQWGGQSQSQNE